MIDYLKARIAAEEAYLQVHDSEQVRTDLAIDLSTLDWMSVARGQPLLMLNHSGEDDEVQAEVFRNLGSTEFEIRLVGSDREWQAIIDQVCTDE